MMNPLKQMKETLPAILTVFNRLLEELEELNATNKEILNEIKLARDSEIESDTKQDKDKPDDNKNQDDNISSN